MVTIETYRDVDKKWRNRFLRNVFGRQVIISDGGESYNSKESAIKTMRNLIKAISIGNIRLKVTVCIIAAVVLTSFGIASAQPVPRSTTDKGELKTTTAPGFLTDVWGILTGPGMTNLSVSMYGTYTPNIGEWGGGMSLDRNIPLGAGISTGVGIGLDWYDEQFYSVAGQLTLDAAIRPLAGFGGWATNIVMTPFGKVGIGTPFGGEATSPGNLETIESVGLSLHVAKVLSGHLGVFGMYGYRSGLEAASGTFYGGGINWTKRF